jgi:GH24 family phage-related lysozyme (muramidase)
VEELREALAAATDVIHGQAPADRGARWERLAHLLDWYGRPAPVAAAALSAVDLALPLIVQFEGCRLEAYPDPLSGGDPWTIGMGSTCYTDGSAVRRGDTISEIQAWNMLEFSVKQYEGIQAERIPTWGLMSAQQQAAILSFAYNLGAHFYGSDGFATITRNLQQADWGAVPQTLKMYCNPGSPVEAGLLRRRTAEGDLWATGSWPA